MFGGIALVHAEQVAGEQGGLVAAGSGPHFKNGGRVLVLVLRGQQQGDLALQPRQPVLQRLQLVAGHGGHLGIAAGGHLLQLRSLVAGALQRLDRVDHGLQLGVLLAQAHDLLSVGGRAHARLDLAEAVEHLIEPGLGKSQFSRRL